MAYIWELPGWTSGTKVRRSCWGRGEYICRLDSGVWDDHAQSTPFSDIMEAVMYCRDWELYVDPPVEVVVFEWMYRTSYGGWAITDALTTEAEAANYFEEGQEYRKTGRSFRVPVTK